MLKFTDRISQYRRSNYFAVNGEYLDLYVPQIPHWYTDRTVALDILEHTSILGLGLRGMEPLKVRLVVGELDQQILEQLNTTLEDANTILAVKLGPSPTWETIKGTQTPRHFLTIVVGYEKPFVPEPIIEEQPEELQDAQQESPITDVKPEQSIGKPGRKSKAVHHVPDNLDPI